MRKKNSSHCSHLCPPLPASSILSRFYHLPLLSPLFSHVSFVLSRLSFLTCRPGSLPSLSSLSCFLDSFFLLPHFFLLSFSCFLTSLSSLNYFLPPSIISFLLFSHVSIFPRLLFFSCRHPPLALSSIFLSLFSPIVPRVIAQRTEYFGSAT